ncbi:hypothetical protein E2320_016862, partial [Naja naja]
IPAPGSFFLEAGAYTGIWERKVWREKEVGRCGRPAYKGSHPAFEGIMFRFMRDGEPEDPMFM